VKCILGILEIKMDFKNRFSLRDRHQRQLSIAILEQPLQSTAEGWLLITAATGKI